MDVKITKVELFKIGIPRETPYLGALGPGDFITNRGYFVRASNSGIYSLKDNSLLIRITCDTGQYGWGECVTVVAPQVPEAIIVEVIEPLLIGRNPLDGVQITEDLYGSMRVRGFWGGFFLDAICAVDIALWDLKGKLLSVPVCQLLGSERFPKLKAYVSGLPLPTREERAQLAKEWQDKGFDSVKVPIIVDLDHPDKEIESLRRTLGDDAKILVDMHWKYTAPEAIKLIDKMDRYDLYVAEAPVNAEDIDGQAQVARSVRTNVAIGEELRTVFEYRPRFVGRCMNVIQPEMGRTGITQFWNICQMARTFHCLVMPHASIGIGVFHAASLQASAACSQFVCHEYQHSIFDNNLRFVTGNMRCADGYFTLPDGPGLGVEPTAEVLGKYVI
jgi:galactonate dehydratase